MPALAHKVALITGASRGIGRVVGERLGAQGATVAINYRSRPEEADDAVRAVEKAGGIARAFQADVVDLADIRRLFDDVESAFGGLDIVVANAGLPLIGAPVVDVTEADFDCIFQLNAKGSFFVLQEGARRVRDGGRLIDVSTSTTRHTGAGMGVHAASKAGSKIIVEVLAIEFGNRGITVNSVMPGATNTEFIRGAPQSERGRVAAGPDRRAGRGRGCHRVPGERRGALDHRTACLGQRRGTGMMPRRLAVADQAYSDEGGPCIR